MCKQDKKKLIISHKLTIGEIFKLLNDINIPKEEICEQQMLPNHSPTIVLLGYCHSLWNTPSDKMVNHVPFFWPLPFLETTQPLAMGWVIQFLFLFVKWKSTPTFAISRVMRPFHETLVMQHICLFPRERLFIFLLFRGWKST